MLRPNRYMLAGALAAIATSVGRMVMPSIVAVARPAPHAGRLFAVGQARTRRNRTAPARPTGVRAARRAARKRRNRSRGRA